MSSYSLSTKVSAAARLEKHRGSLGLGKTKNGEDVSGSINVPEVAHDTEPEDYVVCSQRPRPRRPRAPC
jgi:hypothetical protein